MIRCRIALVALAVLLLGIVRSTAAQEAAPALPLLEPGQHVSISYGESTPEAQLALDNYWFATLEAGASGYVLPFTWDFLESTPGTIDTAAMQAWLDITSAVGLQPLIVIRVIDTVRLTLPSDLMNPDDPTQLAEGLNFDSPQVIERFGALLDRVVPLVGSQGGFFISVTDEIDPWLAANPDQVEPFTVFLTAAREHIRRLWPQMGVGATVTYSGLAAGWAPALAFITAGDAAIFTYYPLNADFTVRDPAVVSDDLAAMVAAAGDLPIIIQEIGYPSGYLPAPDNDSSVEKQRQFVENVFAELHRYPQIRFVHFLLLGDWGDTTCATLQDYYSLNMPAFREYLCSLGMVTYGGQIKPAYDQFLAGLQGLNRSG